MAKCYFELRKQSARGTDSIAADIMRHLHTRQHLGKAAVICDHPYALMCAARKQWLKLARIMQKQRSATLNPDKILKFTHTITRMQHMRFSYKPPLEDPEAEVYFLSKDMCDTMPMRCYSVYATMPISERLATDIVVQMPAEALFVDYMRHTPWQQLGLQPKSVLEDQVATEWRHVLQFLTGNAINAPMLVDKDMHDIEAMDDALDTLLNVSHRFMRVATEFQRALELARPLRMSLRTRQQYDAIVLLAHRVQALSPGAFTQHFLESYNEDDTFFLYDLTKRRFIATGESLVQAVARHLAAGRPTLAQALHMAYST